MNQSLRGAVLIKPHICANGRSEFTDYIPKPDTTPLIIYINPKGGAAFVRASDAERIEYYRQNGWKEYNPKTAPG